MTLAGTSTVTAAVLANYYVTTGSIWFGHWYSHQSYSPLRGFHVLGHHALYPDSGDCLSAKFRAGSGWHDSTFALAPWLVLQLFLEFMALPFYIFLPCLIEAGLIMVAFSYVHAHFHLSFTRMARFRWFAQARILHLLHHDAEVNYMVVDHFWDRRFRTFVVRSIRSFDDRLQVGCSPSR